MIDPKESVYLVREKQKRFTICAQQRHIGPHRRIFLFFWNLFTIWSSLNDGKKVKMSQRKKNEKKILLFIKSIFIFDPSNIDMIYMVAKFNGQNSILSIIIMEKN